MGTTFITIPVMTLMCRLTTKGVRAWLYVSNTNTVLGLADRTQFEYINGSLFATYRNVPSPDGLLRSTNIELICDESTYGRFELVGENSRLFYTFKLYSLCQKYLSTCINVDTCTCGDPRERPQLISMVLTAHVGSNITINNNVLQPLFPCNIP